MLAVFCTYALIRVSSKKILHLVLDLNKLRLEQMSPLNEREVFSTKGNKIKF